MLYRPSFSSLLFVLLTVLAGCGGTNESTNGAAGSTDTTPGGGSGGSGGSSGAGGSAGSSVAPNPNEFAFDTDSYKLTPGEERNYMCYTIRTPPDRDIMITEVEPLYGKGIHHLGIYRTISPEPEGTFLCPELVRDTWLPIYGGGIESGILTMPEGSGMFVPKDTQLLVQLHLLNSTSDPVEDKARIILRTTDDTGAMQAGMFGFDNRDLNIPAHGQNVEQGHTCDPIGVDMDVFAVFGHMHQRGKKIEVSRGANPGDEVLYSAEWSFQDQPTVPAKFHVSKEDVIHVRCWFDNNNDYDVSYGEKTENEMCSFVFYYTPFETLTGCLKFPK